MSIELKELRGLISGAQRPNLNSPYPASVREPVVRYIKKRLSQGLSMSNISKEIGLSGGTLSRWLKRDKGTKGKGSLVPVRIKPDRATKSLTVSTPVLVTPGGYRVEGLDIAGCLQLLRYVP